MPLTADQGRTGKRSLLAAQPQRFEWG